MSQTKTERCAALAAQLAAAEGLLLQISGGVSLREITDSNGERMAFNGASYDQVMSNIARIRAEQAALGCDGACYPGALSKPIGFVFP